MPIQASHSYKKWVIGLGIATAFSGYMTCRLSKKVIVSPSTQPATEVVFKPAQRDALARLTERMKSGVRFDSGIKPEQQVDLTQTEIPPTTILQYDLKQLLANLNIGAMPLTAAGKTIKTNKDWVCPKSAEESGPDIEIQVGGRSIGYLHLDSDSEDPLADLKHQVYYGVLDMSRNLTGYRREYAYMSDRILFVSRSGETVNFFERSGEQQVHPLFLTSDPKQSIGNVNEVTGEISNLTGKVLGAVDKNYLYLLIDSAPDCEEDSARTAKFIRFGSRAELTEFFDGLQRSLGDEWEKLKAPHLGGEE
jgi:hypothetical protein